MNGLTRSLIGLLFLISTGLVAPHEAMAHCDTMNGPVVADARHALQTGVLMPVLKWVRPSDEAEVEAAFERARRVRRMSEEAKELADMYFFETVVRLHRASEGMPYTGLKPASTGVGPAVSLADEALKTGDTDALTDLLTAHVRKAIEQRFEEAYHTRQRSGDSVEAGREYVRAYVLFTHLAETLDAASEVHAEGEAAEEPAHPHGMGGH